MSDDLELVRGSGNVFADFGHANAGAEQEHLGRGTSTDQQREGGISY